jgi:cysteine desulfurase / selenocysteine lyase
MQARIYLDQAATSWPKPECVYQAVDDYQRRLGTAVGRGAYAEAVEVVGRVGRARAALARLIGAEHPSNVIFTFNGTDSLNLAIHGVLAGGGHAITTVAEHNSVLRPLRELESAGRVEVTRVPVSTSGVADPDEFHRALRPETTLIVLTHASNVTGAIQPAAEVGAIAREAGVLFLLDAAQTAGELPLNVRGLDVDLLAAPGHKGLLGPLGTGVLYIRPGVEERVTSFRQGGTGSFSENDVQPSVMPDKYESGNLNVPGILGLGAGVEWLLERGVENIRREGLVLMQRLLGRLAEMDSVTVYGLGTADHRAGLVSFTMPGIDPQEFAAILDSAYRIQVRAGLHCAPLMHQALGTIASGGTVRVSLGPFNTQSEIDLAADAIGQVALQAVS